MTDWSYDAWPHVEQQWHTSKAKTIWETNMDYHVDLGCGRIKKGRIGIDRYPAPGVNVVMDLERGTVLSVAAAAGEDAPEPYRVKPAAPEHTPYELRATNGIGALSFGLPFPDSSIASIISHHCLEHVGEGFLPLIDDIYRVLEPNGIFRAITPLFPSYDAVSDADHCRYFTEGTWDAFCGTPGDGPEHCWLASFSVPYTSARFEMLEKTFTPVTPPEKQWTNEDNRELRVALKAVK